MALCSNCGNTFDGKFCNQCGQKVYTDADRSVWHLVKDALHFITHFEGSFFNSLKAILFHPGKMSLEYCNGIRKKYFRPISLYLLLVVVYLLSPMARGLNMPLSGHAKHPGHGKSATIQIQEKIQKTGKTMAELATLYGQKSSKVSKLLLLILIPLTVLILRILFLWKKRFLFDFFILAIEINIVYIFVFFLTIPILFGLLSWAIPAAHDLFADEDRLAFIMMLLFGTYLTSMFRRFFQARWAVAIPLGMICPFLLFLMDQFVYRYLLFQISFWMV